jgi:hypothetical protein
MKNIQGYLIIGVSIIIGSLVISFFIFKKNNPNNHCYNKVYNSYSSTLPYKTYNPVTKNTTETSKEDIEADAAKRAIYECGLIKK